MVGLTLVALSVGVFGSVLSPSVVLDAVALWPVAALVVPAALLGLKGGRNRALAPLVLLTWMLTTVGLHLGGAGGLPSGAATIRPDLEGVTSARLTVVIPDVVLEMESGDFEVSPSPIGGRGGVPLVEQVSGSDSASFVVTDDREQSPWFRFGEYRIGLPATVRWDLQLRVGSVDLDLTDVQLSGGRIAASTGRIVLGEAAGTVPLTVAGDIEVVIPAGVAARVSGTTAVPAEWAVDGDDAVSPTPGDGWQIRAESGSVRIVTR